MTNEIHGGRGLALLLLCALLGASLHPARAASKATVAAAFFSAQAGAARLDDLRRRGFEASYNLDYEGARRHFEEMARLFPDHPAGPLFLATNVWLKALNESRRLQSSLYNNDSFYMESEEKVDPRVVEQFRAHARQARALAEARLKLNPKDAEALYFLGSVDGVKAAFAASVERKFLGALRDGSNSVERHREVLKLDAGNLDAEFTVGLYDYVVGDLPLPIKVLASLSGVRGSKKRGLERLERVARESPWSGDNAKVVLIAVYKREGRYDEAYRLASELGQKYPRNYLFRMEAADALVLQAAAARPSDPAAAARSEREAYGVFEALLRDPALRRVAPSLDLIHFRYGEALIAAGQPARAASQFLLCAGAARAQDQLITLAHLRAAQALDAAGKRNEALAQYRVVRERPNVFDSRQEAERGLREPYRK